MSSKGSRQALQPSDSPKHAVLLQSNVDYWRRVNIIPKTAFPVAEGTRWVLRRFGHCHGKGRWELCGALATPWDGTFRGLLASSCTGPGRFRAATVAFQQSMCCLATFKGSEVTALAPWFKRGKRSVGWAPSPWICDAECAFLQI
jgi:hypothetical protein